jgi:hypothetical protein
MQTRLIHPIGVRIWLRRYWGGPGDERYFPGCEAAPKWIDGRLGYHNAMLHVEDRIQRKARAGISTSASSISSAAHRGTKTRAGPWPARRANSPLRTTPSGKSS